jgi:hypothetical protein
MVSRTRVDTGKRGTDGSGYLASKYSMITRESVMARGLESVEVMCVMTMNGTV